MIIKLPKQPPKVTNNICLSEKGFLPGFTSFSLYGKLKALSGGQNQDDGPNANIRMELN